MSRRQRLSPGVECLEARTVLSASPGLVAALSALSEGPATVLMTFTETNTTNHDIPVTAGCGVSQFWVTQGTRVIWRNPEPLCPIRIGAPLHAGQSRTFTAVWNDSFPGANPSALAASFVFHGSVDGLTAKTTLVTPPVAPALKATVTADRAVYRVGQQVLLTITETNTGTQPVGVLVYEPESVTVTRDGKAVWQSPLRPIPMIMTLLGPGQSRTLTSSWPGTFNVNTSQPRTGTFIITVRLDNTTAATTVNVVRG
jgi:hypothetical protein